MTESGRGSSGWIGRLGGVGVLVGAFAAPALSDTVQLTTGETLAGRVVEKTADRVVLIHPVLGELVLESASVAFLTLDNGDADANTVTKADASANTNTDANEAATGATSSESSTSESSPPESPSPEPSPAEPGLTPPVGADAVDAADLPAPAAQPDADAKAQTDPTPAPRAAPLPPAAPPEPAPVLDVTREPRGGFFGTGILEDWKSAWSLGLNGFTGVKDRVDLYTRLSAKQEDGDGMTQLKAEAFVADTPNGRARNEGKLELTRRWKHVADDWFVFATGSYRYNRLADWEERVNAYAGVGRPILKGEVLTLSVEMGLGGDYRFGSVDEFSPEAVFGASAFAWKINPRERIEWTARVYPNLEFFGDVRLENELEWRLKLDAQTDTVLKFGLRHEYEAYEDVDDLNDLRYFAAVEFSF